MTTIQQEALDILRAERAVSRPTTPSALRVSNWDTQAEAQHAALLLQTLWELTGGDVGYSDPVVRPGKAPIYGRWEIVSRRIFELESAPA